MRISAKDAALVLATGALLSSFAAAQSRGTSAQTPKHTELSTVADTWIDEAAHEAAHGSDANLVAQLEAGKATRILLGFDLKSIEGAHVESANIQLNLAMSGGEKTVQMALSGLDGEWTETTTWNNQPQTLQTFFIAEVGSQPATITWDATELLRATLEAKGTLAGMAISGPVVATGPAYGRTFDSRDGKGVVPKLVVEYVPGAAVRASPSPGATSTGVAGPPGATPVRIGLISLGSLLALVWVIALLRRRRTVKNTGP